MVIDPNLLHAAKTAGARLAEAERQVLLTRADYHTAIRRLHLAGGSLREIAEALDLSHQRVQQIVDAAGGSWWQVWRTRRIRRDAVCTWCGRPPSEVAKLVAGPNIYICDACIEAAERALQGAGTRGAALTLAPAGARTRCTFCGRRRNDTRPVVIGPANVCGECLRLCREIIDGRESATQEREPPPNQRDH